ncbi:MAG: hypothetical protein ACRCSU_04970, partial [Paracoccaceae bacterium]
MLLARKGAWPDVRAGSPLWFGRGAASTVMNAEFFGAQGGPAGDQTLGLPVIAGGATVHAPALTPGPVTLTAPLLASAGQAFAPGLDPQATTLGLPAI